MRRDVGASRVECRRPARTEGDIGARGRELQRDGATDAAAGAGDEHALAGEIEGHVVSAEVKLRRR